LFRWRSFPFPAPSFFDGPSSRSANAPSRTSCRRTHRIVRGQEGRRWRTLRVSTGCSAFSKSPLPSANHGILFQVVLAHQKALRLVGVVRFVHIAPGLRSLSATDTWTDTRTRTAGTFQSPGTFANTYTDTFSTLKCIYGDTPLLCAAQNRHEAMAKLLIEKGAEFSVQGSLRMTPLHWAALNGHKAVAKLLVEKGANLSEHGNHGNTPLLYAAKEGHEAIAKLLVEKGATSPCTTTTEVCHCIRLHFSLSL
jgi:hypothetical protein